MHIDELKACQAMADADARLGCYDRVVGTVLTAQESGELQIVDKAAIQETRRGLFGFSLPKLGIFGDGDDDDVNTLQSEVTRVRRVGREEYHLTITEGSVWRVADAPSRFKPRVGDKVEFKKASLGSYFVRLNGKMGVKGRRIQ